MKLKQEMQRIEYLEARLWEAIQEIDSNRDSYSQAELRRAFERMTELSHYIKTKIVKGK